MKFKIELTWSKVMALFVLVAAVWLDLKNEGINAFMFSLPFITAMVGVKQFIDLKKNGKNT